ncbi:distal tail protein Dit [Bacillus glycinifermentans]|uniref:distal tail protein Dit n=1 Tax=Bacillus glycinifermentans TaxID=1664069 RepID=UPI0022E27150|nr:distal tail protein Dit [Bacillus glycinifermentans]
MIRESRYFFFGDRKSTDMGIENVNTEGGLVEETFLATSSINETTIKGNDTPFYEGKKRDPKQFNLNFYIVDYWNDKRLADIKRWLDVDTYQPLSFSENLDIVYYAMPVDTNDLVHNASKEGYVRLTMRCDSPYAYSRSITTPLYDASKEDITIEINNKGECTIVPSFKIQKIGKGDVQIENLSNFSSPSKFVDLDDGEIITVTGEKEIVDSSKYGDERYDNFNEEYLQLGYGMNRIRVTGRCKILFNYRFKYR